MNTFENELSQTPALLITPEIKAYLIETSKWGKFLAILGYVAIGIMVLLGLFMLAGSSVMQSARMFPPAAIAIFYIAFSVLYFLPVRYLHKFSDEIRDGLMSDDNMIVVSGFRNLKSLFRFVGIMTIVIISLYILAFICAILYIGMSRF